MLQKNSHKNWVVFSDWAFNSARFYVLVYSSARVNSGIINKAITVIDVGVTMANLDFGQCIDTNSTQRNSYPVRHDPGHQITSIFLDDLLNGVWISKKIYS